MSSLYFIAIVLPIELQTQIRVFQEEISHRFDSQAALKSPPHITLIPPLKLDPTEAEILSQTLEQFCQNYEPVTIHLENFAVFAPRVIYVHVESTANLRKLQTQLQNHLRDHTALSLPQNDRHRHPFIPHVTIGFRDLSAENFRLAWSTFQGRSFVAQFQAQDLSLLHHNGHHWQVQTSYTLVKVDNESLLN
jgi:2'-5' RNA ligase